MASLEIAQIVGERWSLSGLGRKLPILLSYLGIALFSVLSASATGQIVPFMLQSSRACFEPFAI